MRSNGHTYDGVVTVDAGIHPLSYLSGTHDAMIRQSRVVGLPWPLPDFLGLAIEMPDKSQRFALVSSSARPFRRHLPLPSVNPSWPFYSSLLPISTPTGDRLIIGARPCDDVARCFDLLIASGNEGFARVGSVRLGQRVRVVGETAAVGDRLAQSSPAAA